MRNFICYTFFVGSYYKLVCVFSHRSTHSQTGVGEPRIAISKMAQKRMFSKKIIQTDAFMDMGVGSQLLYFHLVMEADDDGFVSSPKKTMKMVGSNSDDYKVLLSKRFLIPFESGVCVIKHWWIHNTLYKDRYHLTTYQDELKTLKIKDNGAYTDNLLTETTQNVNKMLTQTKLNETKLKETNNTPSKEGRNTEIQKMRETLNKKKRVEMIEGKPTLME